MESKEATKSEESEYLDLTQLRGQMALLAMEDTESLSTLMSASPSAFVDLLESINVFLFTACGNTNKLGEMVTALKLQALVPDSHIIHVKNTYGADICLVDRETGRVVNVENKASFTRAEKSYKSNWNFVVYREAIMHRDPMGSEPLEPSEIKTFITNAYENMRDGYVVLRASCSAGELNTYVLEGNFVALLLCRIALTRYKKSAVKVNLGGRRCKSCEEYHRVRHLVGYAELFKVERRRAGGEAIFTFACFTDAEWEDILTTPLICGEKVKQ
jgi:hypothetical protein